MDYVANNITNLETVSYDLQSNATLQ